MFTLLSRAAALAAALLPLSVAAAPLTLEAALDLAVQRSELARAARAGLAGASESARAAGQLPDPTLRAGVDNLPVTGADRGHTARDAMTMKRIGLAQEWLPAGKRLAREAEAEALVRRQAAAVQAAAAETRLQAALAWLDAQFAGEAKKLADRTVHHAHEELEAGRARLASSTGSSPQALALAGARGMAEDEAAEAAQQQEAAALALQRWVGVAAGDLAPPVPLPIPTQDDYTAGQPDVVAMQRDLDLARQAAVVAASERTPNWTWELSYGQRTGYADMLSVGVSIPLQVAPDRRQDRETAARLARVDQAEANLAEAQRAAAAEYQAGLNDAQRLQGRIERWRVAVVAPAEQRTAAAIAGYRSNQVPLDSLFEARHAEVEAQRKLLALRRDLAKAQARLAFKPIVPGDLP